MLTSALYVPTTEMIEIGTSLCKHDVQIHEDVHIQIIIITTYSQVPRVRMKMCGGKDIIQPTSDKRRAKIAKNKLGRRSP